MNEHIYPYSQDVKYIARYNYKYLRLSALCFCKENGLERPNLDKELLNYLYMLSDELYIEDVDINDCVGAVMFLVGQGKGVVEHCIEKYSDPFKRA